MITVSVDDGVAQLVLNRPDKLNAVGVEMMDQLAAARSRLTEPDVRAVLLRGEGRSFCVGADRDHFGPGSSLAALTDPAVPRRQAADRIGELQAGVVWLAGLTCPTVAAVQGHALGLGLQLALLCDIQIAAPDATFAVAEPTWGVIPDAGGTWLLPRLVGLGRAKEMTLTGRHVGAQEALAMGLVQRLVPAGADLAAAGLALAAELAARPHVALTESVRVLGQAFSRTFDEGLRAEAEGQARALRELGF